MSRADKARSLAMLAVMLHEHNPDKSAVAIVTCAEEITRMAARIQRQAENACNYPQSARQEKTADNARANLVRFVRESFPLLAIDTHGDPRGAVVKISGLSCSNGFSREWCM